MRTVSFSEPQIQQKLKDEFICTWTSSEGNPTSGGSVRHPPDDVGAPCARGNGQQNTQLVFLTPQGHIFHVISGFIDGPELLAELEFASNLFDSLKDQPLNKQFESVGETHAQRVAELTDRREAQRLRLDTPKLTAAEVRAAFESDREMQTFMSKLAVGQSREHQAKDCRFCMENPLVFYQQFDQDPTELTGKGKSFFASEATPMAPSAAIFMGMAAGVNPAEMMGLTPTLGQGGPLEFAERFAEEMERFKQFSQFQQAEFFNRLNQAQPFSPIDMFGQFQQFNQGFNPGFNPGMNQGFNPPGNFDIFNQFNQLNQFNQGAQNTPPKDGKKRNRKK